MAYEAVARRFNALGLIEPVDPELRPFHDRPARVLIAYRFADPCLASIADPALRALPPIGGIDQVVDTTDALNQSRRSAASGTCGHERLRPRLLGVEEHLSPAS